MTARISLSLLLMVAIHLPGFAAPVAVEQAVQDSNCAPRMHQLAPNAFGARTTLGATTTPIVDFSKIRPFDGGGQADVYRRGNEEVIYRVPRDQTQDLDELYRLMELTVGDMMPKYRGPAVVVAFEYRGKTKPSKAYVFDLVDPGKFIAPDLENYRSTPTHIRKKVAQSLEKLRDRMKRHGYFPCDMTVENYVFNPNTGDVMVFPDSGIFLPLDHQYIQGHKQSFDAQLKRWNTPQGSDN